MTNDNVSSCMGNGELGPCEQETLARLRHASTAAPQPAELSGWPDVLAAYRFGQAQHQKRVTPQTAKRSRRLRLASVPPVAALITTMLLPTGAVAAAYTGHLPEPVQAWVHAALAPVGVPARHRPTHSAATVTPHAATGNKQTTASTPTAKTMRPASKGEPGQVPRSCGSLPTEPPGEDAGILHDLQPPLPHGAYPPHCRRLVAGHHKARPAATAPASAHPSADPSTHPTATANPTARSETASTTATPASAATRR